jgi:hypothetical protein
MNPHWLHDRLKDYRVIQKNEAAANDVGEDQPDTHVAGGFRAVLARLRWSRATWEEVSLVVIVYGGIAALWGARQAGVFDIVARVLAGG